MLKQQGPEHYNRERKIQGQRRYRKRRSKSKNVLFQSKCDYSVSLTLSNVGRLSWSLIPMNHIQVQKEKVNFLVACLRPP